MALNGTQQSNLEILRTAINTALRDCLPSATPNFCEMIGTNAGYENAEDMVLTYCLKHQTTPAIAIPMIESELAHA